jgi:AcrR family transcriptional regulator
MRGGVRNLSREVALARQSSTGAVRKELAPPRWRRFSPEERRSSILEAARQAFVQTGDMNATTIRAIAVIGGISEGLIYRHFDNKERLFVEAVVEPLQRGVDKLVAASAVVDRKEPLTPQRQLETLQILYSELIAIFDEVLPLALLVLTSDRKIARGLYQDNIIVGMDRLGAVWKQVQERYGSEVESSDVTARAVMGAALMLALESRLNERFDLARAICLTAEGNINGFFPKVSAPPGEV